MACVPYMTYTKGYPRFRERDFVDLEFCSERISNETLE